MATGNQTSGSLQESLPKLIASARQVREFVGVMPNLVDRQRLGANTGENWNEIDLSQLTAQNLAEDQMNDNVQRTEDTLLAIKPTITGITTILTDVTQGRLSSNVLGQMGTLAQNAIQRKKDEDGLNVFAGAGTTLAGTGTSLSLGHISAAAVRITSNATEMGNAEAVVVHHGFPLKDIEDELRGGVGTNPIMPGITADTIANRFRGTVTGAQVFEDGNIAINSTPDARGGVFARGTGGAIVLVEEANISVETLRRPEIGMGADQVFVRDFFAYGERSNGNWLFALLNDATAPTS